MDFGKIISDSKVALLRYLLTIASSFLLIPIVTRFVGEAEYGLWMAVLAVVGVFAAAGGGHMHGALIRYTPTEDRRGQTFADTSSLVVIIGGVFSLVFLLLSSVLDVLPYGSLAGPRWVGVLSIGLLIVTTITSHFLKNYPRSNGHVKAYERIQIIEMALYLLALPAAFLLTESVLVGIWVLIVLYAVLTVALLGYYYPAWVHRPDVSNFETYLRYAIPMIPKELSSRVFSQADRYLILLFISPTAVAVYAVVDQLSNFFRIMTNVLNSTLYPSVSQAWEHGETQELERLYSGVLRGYLLLAIPAFAGLSLLAGPVLELLATPDIAARGAPIVPLLSAGYLVWGAENPLAYVLSASEQTEKIAGITVTTAIGNVALNLALLPVIGLLGAVAATVLMQLLKTAYVFHVARRCVAFTVPTLPVVKSVIATVAMVGGLFVLPMRGTLIAVLVYPVVGVALYGTVLYLLDGFRLTELSAVLKG